LTYTSQLSSITAHSLDIYSLARGLQSEEENHFRVHWKTYTYNNGVLLTIVSLLCGSVVPGRVTLRICRVAVQYAIKHVL